jgi:hypothetical protein
MYIVYICLLLVIQVISFFNTNYKFWAFASTFVVVLFAAFCNGGPDFYNYLLQIDNIRNFDGNIFSAMLISKDMMFGAISFLAIRLFDSVALVFILVAVLSGLFRYLLCIKLGKGAVLFCTLYGLFMAPALDFAAIRAALAVPLIGLAMSSIKLPKRLVTVYFAIASHASALVSVPFAFLNFRITHLNRFIIAISGGFATVSLYSILISFSRVKEYTGNSATINAYIPMLIFALIMVSMKDRDFIREPKLRRLYWVVFGLLVPCFMISPFSVTVSHRVLEILYFLALCILACNISEYRQLYKARICLAFFVLIVLIWFRSYDLYLVMYNQINYFDLNY